MYMARGQFSAARASYQQVDVASRVEAATPHQLVQIVFEELLKSLDTMTLAAERGDYQKRSERQAKALRLISGLEISLDFDRGGEIAISLAVIYREARKRILEGTATNNAELMELGRSYIGEIADAWIQIGPQVDR